SRNKEGAERPPADRKTERAYRHVHRSPRGEVAPPASRAAPVRPNVSGASLLKNESGDVLLASSDTDGDRERPRSQQRRPHVVVPLPALHGVVESEEWVVRVRAVVGVQVEEMDVESALRRLGEGDDLRRIDRG